MENLGALTDLVLKAVALAMGVATVVLGVLGAAPVGTLTLLLGIGLFALALAVLDQASDGASGASEAVD